MHCMWKAWPQRVKILGLSASRQAGRQRSSMNRVPDNSVSAAGARQQCTKQLGDSAMLIYKRCKEPAVSFMRRKQEHCEHANGPKGCSQASSQSHKPPQHAPQNCTPPHPTPRRQSKAAPQHTYISGLTVTVCLKARRTEVVLVPLCSQQLCQCSKLLLADGAVLATLGCNAAGRHDARPHTFNLSLV